jgi:Fur family transcriptional regulator, peroxide stress response regulator
MDSMLFCLRIIVGMITLLRLNKNGDETMQALKTPKEVTDYLKEHKVKPSIIRLKVMQYLAATRLHPNVDAIYKTLSKEIPTLSKTSIYNTLKTFASAGVVREIMIEENELRYDAYIDRHAHFKCAVCGSLQDVALDCVSCAAADKLKGNKVLNEHIYMIGVCSECIKAGKENNNGKKTRTGK